MLAILDKSMFTLLREVPCILLSWRQPFREIYSSMAIARGTGDLVGLQCSISSGYLVVGISRIKDQMYMQVDVTRRIGCCVDVKGIAPIPVSWNNWVTEKHNGEYARMTGRSHESKERD